MAHNELKRGKMFNFGRTMHCLPKRLKSMMLFGKKFEWKVAEKGTQNKENISKNALVFEVTTQTHFGLLHNYIKD